MHAPSREQVVTAVFGGTQRHVCTVRKTRECLADDQYGQGGSVGSEHCYGGEAVSKPVAECAY